MEIGILGLQGDFAKHRDLVERLGLNPRVVRYPAELDQIQGLVIPGGESTTMTKLFEAMGFHAPLREFAASYPILGTCAGLIMMGRAGVDPRVKALDILDVSVARNAFGRQVHSFVDSLEVVTGNGFEKIPATFIRAPQILAVGPTVTVLASFAGQPVAVRQGRHLGLTFHPELNDISLFHRMAFLPDSPVHSGSE
ncbi:MAG: pyridoxal 5'-phosphate synthase glutaminase subunit PdxT [Candidatus Neomarinimicrobiota bacterium]